MSRYIDVDDITKRIQSRIGYFEMYYPNDTKNIGELQNCLELVNETPTAEVKPIVYGKWEIYKAYQCGIEEQWFQCSKCGWENALTIPRNYCPNCGTFMKKESEEEE
jgi:predicted RNA-binding Zn-ribbon protein involved in translation (DUF1610 family)